MKPTLTAEAIDSYRHTEMTSIGGYHRTALQKVMEEEDLCFGEDPPDNEVDHRGANQPTPIQGDDISGKCAEKNEPQIVRHRSERFKSIFSNAKASFSWW